MTLQRAVQLGIVLAGAFLGGSVAVVAIDLPHATPPRPSGAAVARIAPAPAQYNPAAPRLRPAPPSRLAIPTLGVDAKVEAAGPTPQLTLGRPGDVSDVAWYDLGPSPGQPGDAILVGHLDTQTGAPAVFWRLGALNRGDRLEVARTDRVHVNFRVERVYETPYDSVPAGLFATEGPARVTLITCAGAWDAGTHTYSKRLMVEATIAGAQEEK